MTVPVGNLGIIHIPSLTLFSDISHKATSPAILQLRFAPPSSDNTIKLKQIIKMHQAVSILPS